MGNIKTDIMETNNIEIFSEEKYQKKFKIFKISAIVYGALFAFFVGLRIALLPTLPEIYSIDNIPFSSELLFIAGIAILAYFVSSIIGINLLVGFETDSPYFSKTKKILFLINIIGGIGLWSVILIGAVGSLMIEGMFSGEDLNALIPAILLVLYILSIHRFDIGWDKMKKNIYATFYILVTIIFSAISLVSMAFFTVGPG